jgi:hypothetical protein
MAKIKSQSELSVRSMSDFFVPTLPVAILYFLIGGILLAVYDSHQILSWLGISDSSDTTASLQSLSSHLNNSLSTAFGGRIGSIVIWSLVGAITYIIIWLANNLVNSFENDIIVDNYLHPAGFNRAGYWGSTMAGIVFLATMLIILVFYSYIALKVLLPAAALLTNNSVINFRPLQSLGYIGLCLLLSTLIVYIWTRMVKLLAHLWQLL